MQPQKVVLRIVAGTLRRRQLTAVVHAGLRPTPQAVREALFSILGNAVPERAFYDVFAGTGVFGLEALSRGASSAVFVERDFKLADGIDGYLRQFGLTGSGQILRTDAYRWADRWKPPAGPVNVYVSPPFPDLENRPAEFVGLVTTLYGKLPEGSVLSLQLEDDVFDPARLGEPDSWDVRKYGRNLLAVRVKEAAAQNADGGEKS